ncbi:uncharacterized protein LOC119105428 [Pollicipes pollicipes]|uniref:uncharacterized protein LOC119105428 n=1 Tax=Pollicipes pollicipes TaxID=41117 RepID=UPI0018850E62|nr:uncharacterized protein LOC119105428 [Pollicipes pollicipes]
MDSVLTTDEARPLSRHQSLKMEWRPPAAAAARFPLAMFGVRPLRGQSRPVPAPLPLRGQSRPVPAPLPLQYSRPLRPRLAPSGTGAGAARNSRAPEAEMREMAELEAQELASCEAETARPHTIPTLRITRNKDDEYSVQSSDAPPPDDRPSSAPPPARPRKNASFYSFEADETRHTRLGDDGRPRFVCDICQTVYQRLHSIKRHYFRAHINHKYVHESDMASAELTALQDTAGFREEGERRDRSRLPFLYCCYACRTLYDSLAEAERHWRAAHAARPREPPAGKRFDCAQCEQGFATKRELERHGEVHQSQTFACGFCDQVFPCESVKKRHEKIHARGEARPAEAGAQQTIAKINIGGVKVSVGIGNLQQLRKIQEACKEMSETSNGAISLESADLEALDQLVEAKPASERYNYPCAVCQKSFSTYRSMCCHQRMAHPSRPIPSKGRAAVLRCPAQDEEALLEQRAADQARFLAGVARNVAENLASFVDGRAATLPSRRTPPPPAAACYRALTEWQTAPPATAAAAPLSGEWERLACFLCHACAAVFSGLNELEAHKALQHPHVQCGHTSLQEAPHALAIRRGVERSLSALQTPRLERPAKPKPNKDTTAETIERMLANLPAKRISKQLFPMLSVVQLQRRQQQTGPAAAAAVAPEPGPSGVSTGRTASRRLSRVEGVPTAKPPAGRVGTEEEPARRRPLRRPPASRAAVEASAKRQLAAASGCDALDVTGRDHAEPEEPAAEGGSGRTSATAGAAAAGTQAVKELESVGEEEPHVAQQAVATEAKESAVHQMPQCSAAVVLAAGEREERPAAERISASQGKFLAAGANGPSGQACVVSETDEGHPECAGKSHTQAVETKDNRTALADETPAVETDSPAARTKEASAIKTTAALSVQTYQACVVLTDEVDRAAKGDTEGSTTRAATTAGAEAASDVLGEENVYQSAEASAARPTGLTPASGHGQPSPGAATGAGADAPSPVRGKEGRGGAGEVALPRPSRRAVQVTVRRCDAPTRPRPPVPSERRPGAPAGRPGGEAATLSADRPPVAVGEGPRVGEVLAVAEGGMSDEGSGRIQAVRTGVVSAAAVTNVSAECDAGRPDRGPAEALNRRVDHRAEHSSGERAHHTSEVHALVIAATAANDTTRAVNEMTSGAEDGAPAVSVVMCDAAGTTRNVNAIVCDARDTPTTGQTSVRARKDTTPSEKNAVLGGNDVTSAAKDTMSDLEGVVSGFEETSLVEGDTAFPEKDSTPSGNDTICSGKDISSGVRNAAFDARNVVPNAEHVVPDHSGRSPGAENPLLAVKHVTSVLQLTVPGMKNATAAAKGPPCDLRAVVSVTADTVSDVADTTFDVEDTATNAACQRLAPAAGRRPPARPAEPVPASSVKDTLGQRMSQVYSESAGVALAGPAGSASGAPPDRAAPTSVAARGEPHLATEEARAEGTASGSEGDARRGTASEDGGGARSAGDGRVALARAEDIGRGSFGCDDIRGN